MLVFIDESGDAGMKLQEGSSRFFCILAAVFSDNFAADACDRAIDELRRELHKPSTYEFHFSHCSDSIRLAFLRKVATESFRYHAFVINKENLFAPKFRDPKTFYEFATNIVCDNASSLMDNAKVVIDKSGDREFRSRLQSSLKQRLNCGGKTVIRKVTMEDSRSNNLVQLADMLCGAVSRSITAHDPRFHQMVRVRESRVQFWPK